MALPALFALLDKPINALWIAVFATVYQQIENYVFTPRISRRTMDVHPAVALGLRHRGRRALRPHRRAHRHPLAAVALAIIDTFSKRHELVARARQPRARRRRGAAGRRPGRRGGSGTRRPDADPDDDRDDHPDDGRTADSPDVKR